KSYVTAVFGADRGREEFPSGDFCGAGRRSAEFLFSLSQRCTLLRARKTPDSQISPPPSHSVALEPVENLPPHPLLRPPACKSAIQQNTILRYPFGLSRRLDLI